MSTLTLLAAPHVTVAERLERAGVDPMTLDGKDVGPRGAGAVSHVAADGTVIAGVMYQLDYRSEEEVGIGKLRTALTGTDLRNVTLTSEGRARVARFADVNAIVLSTRPLPTRTYAWGDILETGTRVDPYGRPLGDGDMPEYASHYSRALPYTRWDRLAREVSRGRISMAELRARAKSAGLTGLPRTKAALAERFLNSPEYLATAHLNEVWPGWFAFGRHLVLRADSSATGVVIEALGDAIDAGTLAVGTYSGAFASGFFLYDARDETDAIRADRDEKATWYEDRMAELEPVAAELKAAGHGWYFLGRPCVLSNDGGEPQLRYWLNGHSGGVARDGTRCFKQPFGWYSLDELRAEKFIYDAAEREAQRS